MVYSRASDGSDRSYPALESDCRISRSCSHVWGVYKANWYAACWLVFVLNWIWRYKPILHSITWILFYAILRKHIAILNCKSQVCSFLFNPQLLVILPTFHEKVDETVLSFVLHLRLADTLTRWWTIPGMAIDMTIAAKALDGVGKKVPRRLSHAIWDRILGIRNRGTGPLHICSCCRLCRHGSRSSRSIPHLTRNLSWTLRLLLLLSLNLPSSLPLQSQNSTVSWAQLSIVSVPTQNYSTS